MKGGMLEAEQRLTLRPRDNPALEEQEVPSTHLWGREGPRPSFLGPREALESGESLPQSLLMGSVTGSGDRKPSGPYP